jgi:type II secretory pathway predicted ATPase ExeA
VYQDFYRFSRDPFAAPADARQMFMAEGHRDALSSLLLDVLQRRPFVAIAGDGEVGKTTVLNAALANLADQRRRRPVHITRLEHSPLNYLSARQIIGKLLGKPAGAVVDSDLERLSSTLMSGRGDGSQHVLVIDDAPLVHPGALEFLRLVSDLQTEGVPFLQVILAERNDFWETLISNRNCTIFNQIAARSAVEPLADNEARQYIDYRLKLADSSIAQVVTDAALSDIIRHGHALPGRINRVLDRAFTVGAAQGSSRVTPGVVNEAVMWLEAANLLPPVPVVADRRPAGAPGIFTPGIFNAPGIFNTPPGHAGRNSAEAPSRPARAGRDNATGIASRTAGWRSPWLAGTATAAVVGVALVAGILQPWGAPPLVTAPVAPAHTAATAPAAIDAPSAADEPGWDTLRHDIAIPAISRNAGIRQPADAPYTVTASIAPVYAAAAAPTAVDASATADTPRGDTPRGDMPRGDMLGHDVAIPAISGDAAPTETAAQTALPTSGATPGASPNEAGGASATDVAAPALPIPPARPVALLDPPRSLPPPEPPAELAARPPAAEPDAEPARSAMQQPAASPPLAALPAQEADGRTQEPATARLATAPPEPTPMAPPPMAATAAAAFSTSVPAAAPAATRLPHDVLARLLERGAAMLAAGDIASARLLFMRAAQAGSAEAAMEVGKTYEPMFLANRGAIGIQGDPTIASGWYRRALLLGAPPAAGLTGARER